MDDWTYWTLTSILIVVFVFQLTNFNRPWQKLVMQIENMELRHSEMQSRLSRDNDELEALQESLNIVEQEIEKLEATREDMQLEFNKRFMVEIPAGTFTMGGWDEDSPRTELPAHKVQQSAYYIGKTPVTNLEYRDFVKCTGAAARTTVAARRRTRRRPAARRRRRRGGLMQKHKPSRHHKYVEMRPAERARARSRSS